MPDTTSPDAIVGLISDTHGLLRPEALARLAGSTHVIHAGDIGGPEILDRLREIAPLTVVRGNVDTAPWTEALPHTALLCVGGVRIHVEHDAKRLDFASCGCAAVVSGHSHRPSVGDEGGVLWINPGSAGPRRFRLPVTVGRLVVKGGVVRGEVLAVI